MWMVHMSFYTTLSFYRPKKPPTITGKSLAEFIRAFDALRVTSRPRPLTVQLKFGKRIDQDAEPTTYEEPKNAVLSVVRDIKWDSDAHYDCLATMAEVIGAESQSIY